MCGIAGIWNFDGQPVAEALLRVMALALAHRGPDGEGVWLDGGEMRALEQFFERLRPDVVEQAQGSGARRAFLASLQQMFGG